MAGRKTILCQICGHSKASHVMHSKKCQAKSCTCKSLVLIEKHSPEKIIEILRSIDKLTLNSNGELDTLFVDSICGPEGISGFIPGSFTRELLELIEWHLLDHNVGEKLSDEEKTQARQNLQKVIDK